MMLKPQAPGQQGKFLVAKVGDGHRAHESRVRLLRPTGKNECRRWSKGGRAFCRIPLIDKSVRKNHFNTMSYFESQWSKFKEISDRCGSAGVNCTDRRANRLIYLTSLGSRSAADSHHRRPAKINRSDRILESAKRMTRSTLGCLPRPVEFTRGASAMACRAVGGWTTQCYGALTAP